VALDLRFSSRRFVGRDSDSIYSGDRDWRDRRDLTGGAGASLLCWSHRFASRDFDSIYSGGRERRGGRDLRSALN
jgi:hypothetical protein